MSKSYEARIRFFIALTAFLIFPYVESHAADDPVSQAMKLYEKRRYEEAAALLRPAMAALDASRQGNANLMLGMIYMKGSELYRELYQSSLAASQDYLKRLTAAQGRTRSRYANHYMGRALIEAGKAGAAAIYLDRFIADESVEQGHREAATAALALSHYLGGDKEKAEAIWAGMSAVDPEVKAALAASYSMAGLSKKDPVALMEDALSDVKRSGRSASMRMITNAVAVYSRAGHTEKGLELLRRADLKSYSHQEVIGKTKVINFYDSSILGDMAVLYSQAGIANLEKAANDVRIKDAAEFYLGEAYALSGRTDQAMKVMASFLSASQMPPQYKDRIRAWQAWNQHQKGKQADAVAVWDELSRKEPVDPELLSEVVLACSRARAECGQIVKKAEAAVEKGEGRKFSLLNFALGRYHLLRKNSSRALFYMEAGRDKSNKNKIESNEPVMLVNLADMYYRGKKFSEALEIYFEMSKQFPVVRRIQDAMQGVYAMEQKSAGDVKIF